MAKTVGYPMDAEKPDYENEADDILSDAGVVDVFLEDVIATALQSAHEAGRREGLEEAARLTCGRCNNGVPLVDGFYHDTGTGGKIRCYSSDIRALVRPK